MTAQDEPDPFTDLKPHIEALDALFSYLDLKFAPSFRKTCGGYDRSNSLPCQAPPRPNSRCKLHGAKARARAHLEVGHASQRRTAVTGSLIAQLNTAPRTSSTCSGWPRSDTLPPARQEASDAIAAACRSPVIRPGTLEPLPDRRDRLRGSRPSDSG